MIPETGTHGEFKQAMLANVWTYTCMLCHRVFCYPHEQVTEMTCKLCPECLDRIEQQVMSDRVFRFEQADPQTTYTFHCALPFPPP